MNSKEKLKLMQEWQATCKHSDAALALLDAAVGTNDGPLRYSIFTMQAVYTRAISMIIGDDADWLEWFACENDFGRKGLQAGYGKARNKPVKTLRQLLVLVETA